MATLTQFRYTLDPGSRKFRCPACERKRFVRYVDNETGDYLPDDVGRCDRELSCGFHKTPKQADGIDLTDALYRTPEPPKEPKASTLPYRYVERSLGKYEANTFVKWLATLPGWDWNRAESVARLYKVGTGSGDVEGWAIFWQINKEEKVRSGKMIRYDSTGHRMKQGYSYDWIHSRMKKAGLLDDFELVQCLFGLHIVDDSKPVAIVESEKTAIICSQYLPVFHWLAAGQIHGINEYKLRPLKGHSITLFPDIGAFDLWRQKASELPYQIQVSDLLERNASDENEGFDLADYLTRYDLNIFKSGKSGNSGGSTKHIFSEAETTNGYPADWDTVEPLEPGSQEDIEAVRAVMQDAEPDELRELMKADPILKQIVESFDCEAVSV